MDFSIIVPVRNRPDAIVACVKSCYAQNYSPTQYEVIVVDNGSTDDTARRAMESGARVISEPVPNRCVARNVGASVARGRWLAFTDSDCVADPGWLAALAHAEKNIENEDGDKRIGSLAGAIIPAKPTSSIEAYIVARGWVNQENYLRAGRKYSPPFAATANLTIRADVFKEVGGFDPDLKISAEDADWCWRAQALGWNIQYVPEAKVVHHHRSTLRGMLQQAYNYGHGNAQVFAKHRGEWNASRWVEPQRYVWSAKGFIKAPLTMIMARSSHERWFGFCDGLSNMAQCAGRFRGGREHGVLVI